MGGICGWTGCNMAADERRALVEKMIAPVTQYDNRCVQIVIGKKTALALAGHPDSLHTCREQDIIVGLWGHIKFKDDPANRFFESHDVAKSFLDRWLKNGQKVLSETTGEFVACILDENREQCILAVDRMGSRPLVYHANGHQLLFSSSSDALIRHPLAKPEINTQSLFNYLYFSMVPSPDTIYKNQYRLKPGEYLTFQNGNIKAVPYWTPHFHDSGQRSFEELKHELRTLLHSSVRDTIGNRTVGAFLSGGTDSSTIAGILGEVTGKPALTYSIGFEAAGYDEMEYARIAARHFSTHHHEYYVTPDDVVSAIPQVAAIFDQPFGNASAIPAYYCARMAKADGVDRILGGDGGDELFGGNERYAQQYLFSLYEYLPAFVRKKILEPWAESAAKKNYPSLLRKTYRYVEQAAIPLPDRIHTYNLLVNHGVQSVFTAEFLADIDTTTPESLNNEIYHRIDTKSLINRLLAYDWQITLTDNDLPKVVKACELAQMDVAFPLISDEMIAFSTRLQPHYKVKGTRLRYFFKEALKDFLPHEIIAKQKQGFGLPFGVWLQQHPQLSALAADSLTDLKSRHLIRADFIDALLDQHLKEHASYNGTMIWMLMMLEYWYKVRS